MKKTHSQSGVLHLTALLLIIVVLAISAIGVKVLSSSNAQQLGANQVVITSPKPGTVISDYAVLTAQVTKGRKPTTIAFRANDTTIVGISMSKCYVNLPVPQLAEGTFATCFNSTAFAAGTYAITAQAYYQNGPGAVSAPVSVTIDHTDANQPDAAITAPLDNAKVSGYIPYIVSTSLASQVTFYANGKEIVKADMTKCYPTAMPIFTHGMFVACLNTNDPAYSGSVSISLTATASWIGGAMVKTRPVMVYHDISSSSIVQ
jgi:hypothetical protein